MIRLNKTNINTRMMLLLTALLASVCMLTTSLVNGSMAYGAVAPDGDENFNYNGYSATQLKNISECISGVIPASKCPAYEASSKDYYTGTMNHDNMPASGSIINTKIGWRKWADAAMKANSYDGVYGTLRIASVDTGATSSTNNEVSDVRFRLIGINKDNRADGKGKAGLTFQAIGHYAICDKINGNDRGYCIMNDDGTNSGGWRDTIMRKNFNSKSSDGVIWNAIKSYDFRQNVTPVLKTNNHGWNYRSNNSTDAINSIAINTAESTVTADKLWILSPSEMGMPIIASNYDIFNSIFNKNFSSGANVHYYASQGSYKTTIKFSHAKDDGNRGNVWKSERDYMYTGDAYQWWMLPAGSRKTSDGNQAYHNTDSYSYCTLITKNNPSDTPTSGSCDQTYYGHYWLRATYSSRYDERFAIFNGWSGYLDNFANSYERNGVILAFSF